MMKTALIPALAGLCLAVATAAGGETAEFPAGSESRPSAIVLDFSNRAGPEYAFLGKRGADKLQVLLGGAGLFRVLDREQAQEILSEQGPESFDDAAAAVAIRLAEKAGADYAVLGLIRDAGQESRRYQGPYGEATVNLLFTLDTVIKIVNAKTGEILYSDEEKSDLTIRESSETVIEKTNIYDDLVEKGLSAMVARLSERLPAVRFPAPRSPSGAPIAVSISSQPPGADIIIDGIMRGNTPAEIKIEPGLHAIELRRDGYLSWKTAFAPESLASLNPALTLAPPPPGFMPPPPPELSPLDLKKRTVTDEYAPQGGSQQ